MPRIVRPMFSDPKAPHAPRVGDTKNCLGVRTSGKRQDVDLDATGTVLLNRKGLSVSEDWRSLPDFLIPAHLEDDLNGASGDEGLRVFVHGTGTGPFAEGRVADCLALLLKPRSTTAGVVCPTQAVMLDKLQEDLAATRPDWIIDES